MFYFRFLLALAGYGFTQDGVPVGHSLALRTCRFEGQQPEHTLTRQADQPSASTTEPNGATELLQPSPQLSASAKGDVHSHGHSVDTGNETPLSLGTKRLLMLMVDPDGAFDMSRRMHLPRPSPDISRAWPSRP